MNKATFGAGCFWGIEADFRNTKGVTATAVGYEGGDLDRPSYQDVCTGRTGHAEVVEVIFDPEQTNFAALLDIFWQSHDPTTLNRQGPDVGPQYRSVIFFHNEEQRILAETSKEALNTTGRFAGLIVTEISPAMAFFRAEEYHQQYLEKQGVASCLTSTPVRRSAY